MTTLRSLADDDQPPKRSSSMGDRRPSGRAVQPHAAGVTVQTAQGDRRIDRPGDTTKVSGSPDSAKAAIAETANVKTANVVSGAIPTTDEARSGETSAEKFSDSLSKTSRRDLLVIKDLRKSFGKHLALDSVTFSLAAGERLAFLGPNGAGKTTLIRCLSGRCRPDRGSITIDNRPIDSRGIRDYIGLVPQDIALYGDLTTRENLMAFGRFHGLTGGDLRDRVDWSLQWTGLRDRGNELVGRFSGGMKRRVNLACGVLHRPQILLLDEPTVGVDPQSRHKIFEMLDDLSSAGTAIVLTTHHLDEAEQRSDRIVIMDHGVVVANGTIDHLVRQSVGAARMVRLRLGQVLTGRIVMPIGAMSGTPGESMSAVSPTVGEIGRDTIETRIENVSDGLPILLDRVRRSGYEVMDIEVHAPTLHHVFLHLTGHGLRDE